MKVSVVIPVKDEEGNIKWAKSEIEKYLDGHELDFVFVDDGSKDNSKEILKELCEHDPKVKAVFLTKSFGQNAATLAGLKFAEGDVVVTTDVDLQDDPEILPKIVGQLSPDVDIVYATAVTQKEPWWRTFFSLLFRYLAKLFVPEDIPVHQTATRALTRKAVDMITSMDTRPPFIPGMLAMSGLKWTQVKVKRRKRERGKSKYKFLDLFRIFFFAMCVYSDFHVKIPAVFIPLSFLSLILSFFSPAFLNVLLFFVALGVFSTIPYLGLLMMSRNPTYIIEKVERGS